MLASTPVRPTRAVSARPPDELRVSGQLDTVLTNLGRFSDKLLVLDAHARGNSVPTTTRRTGPAAIFERLWDECGVAEVLAPLLTGHASISRWSARSF
jgi:hypothetical protein